MDNNGISDMSHLLSVEVEGFKFAVELGKDAVKFLQRLAAIFSNALKWGMIDKSWRQFKDSGQTNIANFRAKHPEGFDVVTMNKKDYDAFLKFAKKYNIVFMKAPCADENAVSVWIGRNDTPLVKEFENFIKNRIVKEQSRKGAKDVKASVERSEKIVHEPPKIMDLRDYMYENGFMDCSQEEFDDILRKTYGEQCTTLTQSIEKAMGDVDPEMQKKINMEMAEKCRKEDLGKKEKAGAPAVIFEKKQFAGIDKQSQMAFFQMERKPPRWLGVPLDRVIKMEDNGYKAVLDDQSHLTLNTIGIPDEKKPNECRFEPLKELNLNQVRELDQSWRDGIASERQAAHEAATVIKDQAQQQVQNTTAALVNSRGGRKR